MPFQGFNSQLSSLYVQLILFNMLFLFSRLSIMIDTLLKVCLRYHSNYVAVQLLSFQGFNSQLSSLYVQLILFNMLFLFSRLSIMIDTLLKVCLRYHSKYVVVQLMSFQGFNSQFSTM